MGNIGSHASLPWRTRRCAEEMPEAKLIPKFLKSFALQHNFVVHDCMYGSIDLSSAFPIQQSSGAVYGIWAHADEAPRAHLAEIPGFPGWYPVYWGKDISPVSRLRAHVKNHKNGNINLPAIEVLKGTRLIFGAILVSNYTGFEALLHKLYPPLKGSPAAGRQSTVVRIR